MPSFYELPCYVILFCLFVCFFTAQFEIFDGIKKSLVDERPKEFADCVKWARMQFQEYYHNTIQQLLYNFPKDQVRIDASLHFRHPCIGLACLPLTLRPFTKCIGRIFFFVSECYLIDTSCVYSLQVTSSGQPFWSGPKRCPHPLEFDPLEVKCTRVGRFISFQFLNSLVPPQKTNFIILN